MPLSTLALPSSRRLTSCSGRSAQIVVKGRLGLDRAADYLEELRAHSRSRAVSVALLSPSPDTDPDDLDHLERVRAAASPNAVPVLSAESVSPSLPLGSSYPTWAAATEQLEWVFRRCST